MKLKNCAWHGIKFERTFVNIRAETVCHAHFFDYETKCMSPPPPLIKRDTSFPPWNPQMFVQNWYRVTHNFEASRQKVSVTHCFRLDIHNSSVELCTMFLEIVRNMLPIPNEELWISRRKQCVTLNFWSWSSKIVRDMVSNLNEHLWILGREWVTLIFDYEIQDFEATQKSRFLKIFVQKIWRQKYAWHMFVQNYAWQGFGRRILKINTAVHESILFCCLRRVCVV